MGSWVAYGLGTDNQNLPAYVVLDDPLGLPINGPQNWQAGFLPPLYQGTRIRSTGSPILNLAPETAESSGVVQAGRQLLSRLDSIHKKSRPNQLQLDARIASYELAANLQMTASDALDISKESQATLDMYGAEAGKGTFANSCLLARRLVEKGVRFVEIFHESCDQHGSLVADLKKNCRNTDQASAARIKDLKQRGLLDDTLVIWGGEFGRTRAAEGTNGRDHHPYGFTMWLAGGGVKGGMTHGETDEFGWDAVQDRVHVHDLHATILHLLGLDHEKLTYRHAGRDFRLTDVSGTVVKDLFA